MSTTNYDNDWGNKVYMNKKQTHMLSHTWAMTWDAGSLSSTSCTVHVIQVRFGTGSRITLTGVIEFIKPITSYYYQNDTSSRSK